MSEPGRPIGEDDVQAHVDGRLPAERAAAVERFARDNPETARRLAAYHEQRRQLADRLRARAEQPVPSRLRVAAILAARRARRRQWIGRAAAACLVLAAGGGLGWMVRDAFVSGPRATLTAPDPVAQLAVAAHRLFSADESHPVEVGADRTAHLVGWISARLGRPLPVPDLRAEGFALVGGRILPGGDDPAAQIMYQDAAGRRLTIYVKTGEEGTMKPSFASLSGISTVVWRDDGCGYVIAGRLDREALDRIADAAFDQFEAASGSKS